MYLPAFFIAEARRVVPSTFATELHVRGSSKDVRAALQLLGSHAVPFFRTVKCPQPTGKEAERRDVAVVPPELKFESTGYWKAISPGDVGEDKDGNAVVGKTWVERTETWSACSPSSFVVSHARRDVSGSDPGWVYIMRSGSHYADLYKIGLTRRSPSQRAGELTSATGVPTPFGVLAQWGCSDCGAAEAEIHQRLAAMRVNKRREFFKGNLQTIVSLIGEIVREQRRPEV